METMNFFFLRGHASKNTLHDIPLEKHHDMWTHLANALAQRFGQGRIVYWGREGQHSYNNKFKEVWTKKLKNYKPDIRPDVIFARGGFEEYIPFLKQHPTAIQVYYGAGTRFKPSKYKAYDLVLVDDPRQKKFINEKRPGMRVELLSKPYAPHFAPISVKKCYDACFIANGEQAEIKRVKWVYKTIPEDLVMLHLGSKSPYKVPPNVIRKKVSSWEMPKEISRCRVGIVPYSHYDSGPRALSEMYACGLDLVLLSSVHANHNIFEEYYRLGKDDFWCSVRHKSRAFATNERLKSRPKIDVETTADYIYNLVMSAWTE